MATAKQPTPRASRTEGTDTIYIRLPQALLKTLLAEADTRMIDKSVIVERALTEFLPRLVPVDQALETHPTEG